MSYLDDMLPAGSLRQLQISSDLQIYRDKRESKRNSHLHKGWDGEPGQTPHRGLGGFVTRKEEGIRRRRQRAWSQTCSALCLYWAVLSKPGSPLCCRPVDPVVTTLEGLYPCGCHFLGDASQLWRIGTCRNATPSWSSSQWTVYDASMDSVWYNLASSPSAETTSAYTLRIINVQEPYYFATLLARLAFSSLTLRIGLAYRTWRRC